MHHQCRFVLLPLAALDGHSRRLEERNIGRHRSKDIRWSAELRRGLNKISNLLVVAEDSMAAAADSSKAVAAHNLAADNMAVGGSNNREQLELALRDFGDIFLAEHFPHQNLVDRKGRDRYSNKKLQKIKFQQQANSKKNYALRGIEIETLKLIISCWDLVRLGHYQLE